MKLSELTPLPSLEQALALVCGDEERVTPESLLTAIQESPAAVHVVLELSPPTPQEQLIRLVRSINHENGDPHTHPITGITTTHEDTVTSGFPDTSEFEVLLETLDDEGLGQAIWKQNGAEHFVTPERLDTMLFHKLDTAITNAIWHTESGKKWAESESTFQRLLSEEMDSSLAQCFWSTEIGRGWASDEANRELLFEKGLDQAFSFALTSRKNYMGKIDKTWGKAFATNPENLYSALKRKMDASLAQVLYYRCPAASEFIDNPENLYLMLQNKMDRSLGISIQQRKHPKKWSNNQDIINTMLEGEMNHSLTAAVQHTEEGKMMSTQIDLIQKLASKAYPKQLPEAQTDIQSLYEEKPEDPYTLLRIFIRFISSIKLAYHGKDTTDIDVLKVFTRLKQVDILSSKELKHFEQIKMIRNQIAHQTSTSQNSNYWNKINQEACDFFIQWMQDILARIKD